MVVSVEQYLNPQTELEKRVIADSDFIVGCDYGEPRRGHPEGKVIYHIAEVLRNIESFSKRENKADLRLVGLIHDTFKFKVAKNQPKVGENHHGMIARRFAENFISTNRVLETIELHDEAYNSWCLGKRNQWRDAELRARRLIERVGEDIDFYLEFHLCDNRTGDKSVDNYNWFEDLALK